MSVPEEAFDQAVTELAREAGVDGLLLLPGVWEIVVEEFNNAAIDRVKRAAE